MNGDWAVAFAPASVGNVGVGFDILGHTIAGVGDRAKVRKTADRQVSIRAIEGLPIALPREARENTAGAALLSLQAALELDHGFEIILEKGIPLGSGMGGSAASCVAALVAANALLATPLSREQLYPHALVGEAVASGGRHGDNVGPMLLGGLVLASADRLVRIPVPDAWHCVLVHPHAVLETRRAREALRGDYQLGEFVAQSGQLALVLAGCFKADADLVRAGLRDLLVEPRRAPLIVGFHEVQRAAMSAGALGSSISGAGPSVFAWFESRSRAEAAAPAMQAAFLEAGFGSESYVSAVAGPAASLQS